MEMKNLFEFATKELSQDAFLRWLFENFDCEDEEVRKASRSLLISFIGDDKHSESDIVTLKTVPQDHKADISVWLEMSNGDKYGIIIEDKTYSNEHNQLVNYKKIFDGMDFAKEKNNTMVYIFYKIGYIQKWEQDVIEKANWKEYSIKKIYDFWFDFKNSNNFLLKNYAEHIVSLHDKRVNNDKPKKDDHDVIKWRSYFDNNLIFKFDDYTCWVGSTYFGYAYIGFHAKCFDFHGAPYLEVRSRDCHDDKFQARILTYGMDNNKDNVLTPEECKMIRDEVRQSINNNSKLFKSNNGEKKNKQLGVSKKIDNIDTNDKFYNITKEYLENFEKIMEGISFKYEKK